MAANGERIGHELKDLQSLLDTVGELLQQQLIRLNNR